MRVQVIRATSCVTAAPGSCCWGAALSGGQKSCRRTSACTGTGRSVGKKNATFKDRFCVECCRDGVLVPTAMVRALVIPCGVSLLPSGRST